MKNRVVNTFRLNIRECLWIFLMMMQCMVIRDNYLSVVVLYKCRASTEGRNGRMQLVGEEIIIIDFLFHHTPFFLNSLNFISS